MNSGDFAVTIKRREVVAAALPVQEHWLPMSNLDLLLPPLHFGIFFCYKNIERELPENMAAVLKKSLAQALVYFAPLAGEIVANGQGEPEILCNNRGVDFTHAYAGVELGHVDFYRPGLSVHGKLVPVLMHGVLSVQVTDLKCGGVFIGCTFDHRAADAYSANMFLTAWADIARSNPINLLPSFRRSLFNPRRPPQPHPSLDKLYAPPLQPSSPDGPDGLTSRIYYIHSDEIDHLQSQSSCNGTRKSKLESFSAFLWQTLASAAVEDRSKTVKLGVVVDGRARLSNGKTMLLESYFGNVLSVPYVEASAGILQSTPLNVVADMVSACIAIASTAEHFIALIDWVEVRRPKAAMVRVYCKDERDEAAVVVSSGQRFPVQMLDFGWGGPDFGSYHFPWGGETGYVMPMPSPHENGDWIVYMHLKEKHLNLVETHAPHVFKPLSPHYLKF
ncbi:coniferyl alcohol acyltransferase-like [Salvia divinorum]|uniref:Coniferyl alcohol acyltransferase-like n=1 Tax=Salvia divinorum TaxID=28513 RepID=A0ABD1GUR9_SALDI